MSRSTKVLVASEWGERSPMGKSRCSGFCVGCLGKLEKDEDEEEHGAGDEEVRDEKDKKVESNAPASYIDMGSKIDSILGGSRV